MDQDRLNHGTDSLKEILFQNTKIWMMLEWSVFIIKEKQRQMKMIKIIKL